MSKPLGRLKRDYRILWNEDGGTLGFYNPPMTADEVARAHFGMLEGTQVDAYLAALGNAAGYTTVYPTKVRGMEFAVDRLAGGAKVGGVHLWRYAENVRSLWERGLDPVAIQLKEARRLGMDFWFQLRMNDWHHADAEGKVANLLGSPFFGDHPEWLIGKDGIAGWPESMKPAATFQDYAHSEVRRVRLETMAEACERYDIDGFQYDFLRCPCYFKRTETEKNIPVMTDFIRETRTILDRIGRQKGRILGLSVRVPNTIAGARGLGLDVPAWVAEGLVDMVVPSTFFNADLEENITEWSALVTGTPVRICPAIEEAYNAGHTGGWTRCFYRPPVMLPLSPEMISAIAARHWRNGADGLYVFNWFGTPATYDVDISPALKWIGDPGQLTFRTKRYVVMRWDGSFINCLPGRRQIPVRLDTEPVTVTIDVVDDPAAAGPRMARVFLRVNIVNLTSADRVEVSMNGCPLNCADPLLPGRYGPESMFWQTYEIDRTVLRCGTNTIAFQARRNPRTAGEISLELADVELGVEYD